VTARIASSIGFPFGGNHHKHFLSKGRNLLLRFATTRDNVRIAFETLGEGTPVLLLHGFASSREQNWHAAGWYKTLAAAGCKVIAFDFRGHGDSQKLYDPAAYGEKMAADILAVMEEAEAPTAGVIGYSMGGIMGIHLLLKYPERVTKLVVAGVGEKYFTKPLHYRKIAEALEAAEDAPLADAQVRRFRGFATQKGKDRMALAACIRKEFPRHKRETLAAAMRPVLVVCGDHDDSSGMPEPLAGAFPDGRAVVLPGRNHMNAVGDAFYKESAVAFLRGKKLPKCPPPAG
jgi:pimeloyl-ACP methyl ester carboxylesterase